MWIGAGASALLTFTTAAVASTGVAPTERSVARAVVDLPPFLTPLLTAAMQAGTRGAIVLFAVGTALVVRRWRPAATVVVAGAAAWLVATIGKELVGRPRPTAAALGRPLRETIDSPGFPSAHAAIAAAIVLALVLALRPRRWAAGVMVGLAVATAIARVHIGVHWPLDVVGGASAGACTACLATALVQR